MFVSPLYKEFSQHRSLPECRLLLSMQESVDFGQERHVAIAEHLGGHGIDIYVASVSGHGMVWATVCRGVTQYARQVVRPDRGDEEVPNAERIPVTPPIRSLPTDSSLMSGGRPHASEEVRVLADIVVSGGDHAHWKLRAGNAFTITTMAS